MVMELILNIFEAILRFVWICLLFTNLDLFRQKKEIVIKHEFCTCGFSERREVGRNKRGVIIFKIDFKLFKNFSFSTKTTV